MKDRRVLTQPDVPLQPLVLRRLQVRCGPWRVRELRVNRHLEPFDRMSPHRHPHGQLLLYLRGQGIMRIEGKDFSAGVGSVFFIPAGRRHGFQETGARRAICLVADLHGEKKLRRGRLSAEQMAEIRMRWSQLANVRNRSEFAEAGSALLILGICREACEGRGHPGNPASGVIRLLERSFRQDTNGRWPSVAKCALVTGFQKDYLNRLIRGAIGLTLGQWRAKKILEKAEHELKKSGKIQDIAWRCGFPDPNYFHRWFRQQTGSSPRTWRMNRAS